MNGLIEVSLINSRGGNPNIRNKDGHTGKRIFNSIQVKRKHERYVKDASSSDFFGKALAIAAGAGLAAGSSMNSG